MVGEGVAEIRELEDGIYLVERSLGSLGPSVTGTVVVGQQRVAIIDTLSCPADMQPVMDLLRRVGLPPVVVNTHADWDHAWGNAAFPEAAIVGHRLCRQRLLDPAAGQLLREMQGQHPAWFGPVTLVPPSITFEHEVELDLGGVTVALRHLPGHTADCLVAHLPERGILLAGDCAEAPLPLIEDPSSIAPWARALRWWSEQGLRRVVLCHGGVAGPELLVDNARYLEGLLGGAPELPGTLDPFYYEGHQANLQALQGATQRGGMPQHDH